jgi:regulatory protein
MKLSRMTALGSDGSRVMLWLDDGSKMRIPTALVADFGLYGGMELTEEALGALMDAAQRASAKQRAVRIVSATSISEKALKQRLIQRGERPEDAAEAVDYLRNLGALDDQAMARQVVRRCLDKGYGESRIRQTLYEKGIPKEYWQDALSDLPDMGPAIDRFLERRFRDKEPDQSEIKKASDALLRRGHSWGDISRALRRYQQQLEDWD